MGRRLSCPQILEAGHGAVHEQNTPYVEAAGLQSSSIIMLYYIMLYDIIIYYIILYYIIL